MKRSLLMLVLLTSAGLAGLAPAEAQINQALTISSSLDPGTLTPGTQGTLSLDMRNAGNLTITSITLRLNNVPEGIGIEGGQHFVGGLGAGDRSTFALRVDVDPNASAGRYLLPIVVDYCRVGGNCGFGSTHTASIRVQDGQELVFEGVSPSQVPRVGTTSMEVTVRNPGTSAMRDILVEWSVDDGDILPLGRDNRFTLPRLEGGATHTFSTPVAVSPGADSGLQTLRLTATYRDIAGSGRNVMAQMGLVIGGPTQFDAGAARLVDDILTFTLANIGNEDADSVVVHALAADGTRVGTEFLGTLERGDYATVSMPVSAGSEPQSLEIEASDDLGGRDRQSIPVAATKPAAQVEESPSGLAAVPTWAWAAVALVLVAGFVIMRRRRMREDDL